MLWDLVHDRAHSHGDLPFDPFMIRQRMPYWMYSLEELRCDLTAFVEAMELEREGFAFARHVQYAILFDRLFRFPVTGHAREELRRPGRPAAVRLPAPPRATCTGPTTGCASSGRRVADGVVALREEVLELYRDGIDRSKLAQWGAAHDLVATLRPAGDGLAVGAKDARSYAEVEDPRPLPRRRPARRVPAVDVLHLAQGQARARARPPRSRRAARARGRMSGRLEGRVVAVAGAGGSLGPVVVRALAAEGAARRGRRDRDADLLASLGDAAAHTATADLVDADGARAWRDAVARDLGRGRRAPAPRRRLARRPGARTRRRSRTSTCSSACSSARSSTRRAPSPATCGRPATAGASRSSPPPRPSARRPGTPPTRR